MKKKKKKNQFAFKIKISDRKPSSAEILTLIPFPNHENLNEWQRFVAHVWIMFH